MNSTQMETTTFSYSQETIKQKQRVIIASALCMPVMMITFAYFIPKVTYSIALLTIVIGESTIFFQSRRLIKQLSGMKILLGDNAIERQSGAFLEQYHFKDINALVVSQDKSKNTLSIKLKAGKKEVVFLAGFEKMNTLSNILIKKLAPEIVSFKETKIIPVNSSFLVGVGALATTLIIISLIRTNEYTYEIFSSAFQMLLGLSFLFFAPISKVSGIRHRKFEIIGGSLLAVIGAALLIMNWSDV